MVKVKICGITNPEDALMACELGADALGFIFVKTSPRYIRPQAAKAIIKQLPPFVAKVGVFVNATNDSVQNIAATTGLTLIQLHGDEPPDYCENIALPVIKAFRVHREFDIRTLTGYACTAYLLDTYSEKTHGGTGETFDWQIATRAKTMGRIVLAGGINPENITHALITVAPYAVDVSSGIESKPGKKDFGKMKSLFQELERMKQSG